DYKVTGVQTCALPISMANEKILMVMMAVTDMAKAKAFYAEQLGFQVTTDYGQGDQHWVTLEPPGGGASLTLSTMHGNMRPGTMRSEERRVGKECTARG